MPQNRFRVRGTGHSSVDVSSVAVECPVHVSSFVTYVQGGGMWHYGSQSFGAKSGSFKTGDALPMDLTVSSRNSEALAELRQATKNFSINPVAPPTSARGARIEPSAPATMLSIDVSSDTVLAQFLQMPPGQVGTLETLQLRFGYTLDNFSAISAFKDAPRLRNLAIEINANFSFGQINSHFPWSQLACLFLGNYIDVATWHTIIRQCPSLQVCALGIQAMTEAEIFENEDVTLHHLTHFCLTLTGPAFPPVFDGLLFPVLKQLRIANNNNSPECGFSSWDQPLEFYEQFRNLQALVLYQQQISLSDFLLVLSDMTSLVKLVINSDFNYDCLMDALVYKSEGEIYIPRLENLVVRVVDKDRPKTRYPVFSCKLFIRMVDSRWWDDLTEVRSIARLRQVSLDIDDYRKGVLGEIEQCLIPHVYPGLRVGTRLIAWQEWLEEQPWPFSIKWWKEVMEDDV